MVSSSARCPSFHCNAVPSIATMISSRHVSHLFYLPLRRVCATRGVEVCCLYIHLPPVMTVRSHFSLDLGLHVVWAAGLKRSTLFSAP